MVLPLGVAPPTPLILKYMISRPIVNRFRLGYMEGLLGLPTRLYEMLTISTPPLAASISYIPHIPKN